MVLTEIRPRLWRWSVRHPEATLNPAPGSASDWPPEVGCVACALPDAFVFIDPLVPSDGTKEFWSELEGLVKAHGKPVLAPTTIKFHRRSRDEFVRRFGASTSRARAALPTGIKGIPIPGAGETMFWLEGDRTLVPGDRLLGDGAGGLRTCPESWLGYLASGITVDGLRAAMRPLLEHPVEAVLVSHGEPVLEGGRAAIAAALGEDDA
ncbi:MAG: hypothetical protein EXQ70_03885 [Solirubrobacterales bacterium]|nr:hypothetical protein [Solirubrobacterales bacterium]